VTVLPRWARSSSGVMPPSGAVPISGFGTLKGQGTSSITVLSLASSAKNPQQKLPWRKVRLSQVPYSSMLMFFT